MAPVSASTRGAGWIDVVEQGSQFVFFERIGVWMMAFEQRVGSARFLTLFARRHEIREFADMAACFEHSVRGNGRAREFNHVSQTEPVVQPKLVNSGSHSPTDGAEIVEATGPTVDFEGGKKKTSPLQHPAESLESAFIAQCPSLQYLAEARPL